MGNVRVRSWSEKSGALGVSYTFEHGAKGVWVVHEPDGGTSPWLGRGLV